MMNLTTSKINFIQALFLFTTIGLLSSCSSDGDDVDCTAVEATLTAELTSSQSTVCIDESVDLTITGTPQTTVNYTDGNTSESVSIGSSGALTFTVTPTATTTYSLETISSGECNKIVNSELTVEVSGTVSDFETNIVGEWSIWNVFLEEDDGTITFNTGGTGIVTAGSTLNLPYNGEPSTDTINWSVDIVFNDTVPKLLIDYNYASGANFGTYYNIFSNNCNKVELGISPDEIDVELSRN